MGLPPSSTTRVGIGVGIGVGLFIGLVLWGFLFLYLRRKAGATEGIPDGPFESRSLPIVERERYTRQYSSTVQREAPELPKPPPVQEVWRPYGVWENNTPISHSLKEQGRPAELPSPYQESETRKLYLNQWRSAQARGQDAGGLVPVVPAPQTQVESQRPTTTQANAQSSTCALSPLLKAGSDGRDATDLYTYTSLQSPSSIRLLKIMPGEASDPIKCQLFEHEIEAVQQYEAISYVWGSNVMSAAVECNGQHVLVTHSLETALRRVRLKETTRTVWTDAICIDQENVAERGHQVRLMQKVYTRATRVLVWLGLQDTKRVEMAFDLVHKISQLAVKEGDHDNITIPRPSDKRWQALSDLFSRPWFWRLWVIQEITSASSGEVMWGDHQISWSAIGLTAAWLRATGYEVFHKAPMIGVYNAYLMHEITEEVHKGSAPALFRGLLTLTRQFQSTDPRDRVYAILGLPHQDRALTMFIEPDYTKSVEEVYFEAAQRILMSANPMKLLGAVQHGPSLDAEQDSSLPSWVPQWHRLYTHRLEAAGISNMYDASMGLGLQQLGTPIVARPFSGSILPIQGFPFGAITSISEVFPRQASVTEAWSAISGIWSSSIALLDNPVSSRSKLELYSEILTAGKDWYGEVAKTDQNFGDFISFIWHASKSSSDPLTQELFSIVQEDGLDAYRSNGRGSSFERFSEAIRNGCEGRRLLKTDNGVVGLGPEAMEMGDRVCVIAGSRVFLTLRPHGQHFLLVGEAYVPGHMNGEAVEQWRQGGERELLTLSLK